VASKPFDQSDITKKVRVIEVGNGNIIDTSKGSMNKTLLLIARCDVATDGDDEGISSNTESTTSINKY